MFRYLADLSPALRGVTFSCSSREKIGVVGRTGSGKSTLSMALFRIAELVSGRVLIDGVDLAAVALKDLRSRVAVIPQSPVLFSGVRAAAVASRRRGTS